MKISGTQGINTYVCIYHKPLLGDIVFKCLGTEEIDDKSAKHMKSAHDGNREVLGSIFKAL